MFNSAKSSVVRRFQNILLHTHKGWEPNGQGYEYRGPEITNPVLRQNGISSIRSRLTKQGLIKEVVTKKKTTLEVILEAVYELGKQEGLNEANEKSKIS